MSRRVTAQTRGLVVPPSELLHACRLRLTERLSEVVEKVVGIAGRKPANELVAVLDERRVSAFRVALEHDVAQRKGLGQSARRRRRADRNFDDDDGLWLKRRAGHC